MADDHNPHQEPSNGGESGNRGESAARECARLARQLEATGHGGCAADLEAASAVDAAEVAYSVAEHLEEACGDPDFSADPELVAEIKAWADKLERIDPAVARKGTIPINIHRSGGQLFVDLNPDDLLDLSREGDSRVTLTVAGEPVMDFMRLDSPGPHGVWR